MNTASRIGSRWAECVVESLRTARCVIALALGGLQVIGWFGADLVAMTSTTFAARLHQGIFWGGLFVAVYLGMLKCVWPFRRHWRSGSRWASIAALLVGAPLEGMHATGLLYLPLTVVPLAVGVYPLMGGKILDALLDEYAQLMATLAARRNLANSVAPRRRRRYRAASACATFSAVIAGRHGTELLAAWTGDLAYAAAEREVPIPEITRIAGGYLVAGFKERCRPGTDRLLRILDRALASAQWTHSIAGIVDVGFGLLLLGDGSLAVAVVHSIEFGGFFNGMIEYLRRRRHITVVKKQPASAPRHDSQDE